MGCRPRANGRGLRPASRWTGTGDQRQRPISGSGGAGTDQGAPRRDTVRNRTGPSHSDTNHRRGESPVPALSHRGRQHPDYSTGGSASRLAPIAVVGGAASANSGGGSCIYPHRGHRARPSAPRSGGEAAPRCRRPGSGGGPGDGASTARPKACCRTAGTQCRRLSRPARARASAGTERQHLSVAGSWPCPRRLRLGT